MESVTFIQHLNFSQARLNKNCDCNQVFLVSIVDFGILNKILVLALWVRYKGLAIPIMEIPASVHTKCIEMIHLPKLYLQKQDFTFRICSYQTKCYSWTFMYMLSSNWYKVPPQYIHEYYIQMAGSTQETIYSVNKQCWIIEEWVNMIQFQKSENIDHKGISMVHKEQNVRTGTNWSVHNFQIKNRSKWTKIGKYRVCIILGNTSDNNFLIMIMPKFSPTETK